ncbi:hypothetical protein EDC04DRAFT_2774204 [Pisolithus marmoratus]|nr:hypothetical protein EDC04DRAFT_2774204 [Pisolithus marmoratus]
MIKKLSWYFQRLLRMLGMAREYPMIKGLFTGYQQLAFLSSSIEPWYDGIRRNHITCHCIVVEVIWYKKQNGVEHEFLRFNIFSPDKKHIAIVIAERAGSIRNMNRDPSDPTQPANTTIAPIDAMTGPIALPFTLPDLTGDSAASSDDERSPRMGKATKTNRQTKQKAKPSAQISSISSSSPRGAHDLMCNKATRICGLKFSENGGPSANELATLLDVTSKHEPAYTLINTQCYWFVATVFAALKSLFVGAEQDITTHQGGTWNGLPIRTKESLDEVCAKYRAARAALLEEIELKRRVEHQQEDERQREREQCQAAEEAAKRERKKRQAAEDTAKAAEDAAKAAEDEKQRERKKRQIAEDAAKVAEDEKQRERKKRQVAEERARAAEEANAKLLRDLEALQRAGAARQAQTLSVEP